MLTEGKTIHSLNINYICSVLGRCGCILFCVSGKSSFTDKDVDMHLRQLKAEYGDKLIKRKEESSRDNGDNDDVVRKAIVRPRHHTVVTRIEKNN